jgi:hypothetical protein
MSCPREMLEKEKRLNSIYSFVFFFFWIWIGFVSCLDTMWIVKYADQLAVSEENPIAFWILKKDDFETSRLVAIKMFGTICVLGILKIWFRFSIKYALTLTIALAIFQSCLLFYLMFF